MTDEERKKLNDKLLKFAGFEPAPGCKDGCHVIAPPPSYKVIPTPDFTRDLNPLIRWILPAMKSELPYGEGYSKEATFYKTTKGRYGVFLEKDYRQYRVSKDPALALCRLIVETQIDAKKD